MRRRPTKSHETLPRWITYLRSRPDETVSNRDLVRILWLIIRHLVSNRNAADSSSAAASTALYVANKGR